VLPTILFSVMYCSIEFTIISRFPWFIIYFTFYPINKGHCLVTIGQKHWSKTHFLRDFFIHIDRDSFPNPRAWPFCKQAVAALNFIWLPSWLKPFQQDCFQYSIENFWTAYLLPLSSLPTFINSPWIIRCHF